MRNVDLYLPAKNEHNNTYGYWVRMTSVLNQSEVLYGYHGNQIKLYIDFESLWQGSQFYI